jgi:hypothetical protein
MSNWPSYESHKVVRAMRIASYKYDAEGTMTAAVGEDGAEFVSTVPSMMQRSVPGDYAVIYADGFHSVSPAKAFEEGYTRVVSD